MMDLPESTKSNLNEFKMEGEEPLPLLCMTTCLPALLCDTAFFLTFHHGGPMSACFSSNTGLLITFHYSGHKSQCLCAPALFSEVPGSEVSV